MDKTLSLHNYENCIVNLSNSVLSKFGAPTVGKTLPLADDFKGVHAGYTKDELLIPIIVFDSNK